MIPAALELLMRRLQVKDRKALYGAAMVSAEIWNSAGRTLNLEARPQGMAPSDFLPELPEDRARLEAEAEEERTRPINPEQFASFKEGLMALTRRP